MKIGLDGIILRNPVAGSHRYFAQLLAGFDQYATEDEFIVFADQQMFRTDTLPHRQHISYHNVRVPNGFPAALYQQLFAGWNVLGKLDLLHSAAFVPPLWYNRPSVATIFDLAFAFFPETTYWAGRWWRKLLIKPGIARAAQIIALSESAKRDICRWANVPADRVRIVYPYVQDLFRPAKMSDAILARYNLPDKYILHVGTLERRKNIVTLIRAFALARQMGNLDHALVLVGARGWLEQDIFRAIDDLGLRAHVILLGYVPDEHLPALYTRAGLFAYLSLYEGFGLPVLEAMACGAPVLASSAAALPEVVGNAGVIVAPDDVPAIAHEIVRILGDSVLRETLRALGFERAREFSPARFVQQTLEVYKDAGCN